MRTIKTKFIKKFSKDLAEKIIESAESHENGVNSNNKGSDPFKWALLICIGYQCFESDGYREHHGIKGATFKQIKKWIIKNGELGTHDGDSDYLAVMAGTYNEYVGIKDKS